MEKRARILSLVLLFSSLIASAVTFESSIERYRPLVEHTIEQWMAPPSVEEVIKLGCKPVEEILDSALSEYASFEAIGGVGPVLILDMHLSKTMSEADQKKAVKLLAFTAVNLSEEDDNEALIVLDNFMMRSRYVSVRSLANQFLLEFGGQFGPKGGNERYMHRLYLAAIEMEPSARIRAGIRKLLRERYGFAKFSKPKFNLFRECARLIEALGLPLPSMTKDL